MVNISQPFFIMILAVVCPKNMESAGLGNIRKLLVALKNQAHFGPLPPSARIRVEKRPFAICFEGLFHRKVLLQSMNALRMNVGYTDPSAFTLSYSDG